MSESKFEYTYSIFDKENNFINVYNATVKSKTVWANNDSFVKNKEYIKKQVLDYLQPIADKSDVIIHVDNIRDSRTNKILHEEMLITKGKPIKYGYAFSYFSEGRVNVGRICLKLDYKMKTLNDIATVEKMIADVCGVDKNDILLLNWSPMEL